MNTNIIKASIDKHLFIECHKYFVEISNLGDHLEHFIIDLEQSLYILIDSLTGIQLFNPFATVTHQCGLRFDEFQNYQKISKKYFHVTYDSKWV